MSRDTARTQAERWRVTPQAVRRWRKLGVDIEDDDAIRAYILEVAEVLPVGLTPAEWDACKRWDVLPDEVAQWVRAGIDVRDDAAIRVHVLREAGRIS